ncbi:hypothetical protein SKZB199_1956 [Streptococcus sp. ZB199]|nr:hypothetical protein SKZB199_1956 [Streptococcus sp. ZB199]
MIGLGTFYNALGVVFGGLLGLLIGQRLSEDFHETLLKVTGVAVFVLGIAGPWKRCWWCMEVMWKVTAV